MNLYLIEKMVISITQTEAKHLKSALNNEIYRNNQHIQMLSIPDVAKNFLITFNKDLQNILDEVEMQDGN